MSEVAPGVHRLRGAGWGVNAYLVLGRDRGAVLVDAGMPGRGPAILAELKSLGCRPAWIVLTHADPDHIGGSNYLRERTGAHVCAPLAERAVLTGEAPGIPAFRGAVRRLMLLGQQPPVVDRWLLPAETVEELEVVASPGHTSGHISLRSGPTLIAGDAFQTSTDSIRERPSFLTEDRAAARRSIESFARLGFTTAVCGHGPPVQDASPRLQQLVATWSPR